MAVLAAAMVAAKSSGADVWERCQCGAVLRGTLHQKQCPECNRLRHGKYRKRRGPGYQERVNAAARERHRAKVTTQPCAKCGSEKVADRVGKLRCPRHAEHCAEARRRLAGEGR